MLLRKKEERSSLKLNKAKGTYQKRFCFIAVLFSVLCFSNISNAEQTGKNQSAPQIVEIKQDVNSILTNIVQEEQKHHLFSQIPYDQKSALAQQIFTFLSSERKKTLPKKSSFLDKRKVENIDHLFYFYAENSFKPYWIEGENISPKAQEYFSYMEKAYYDGLKPEDYTPYYNESDQSNNVPELSDETREKEKAERDISISLSFVKYAQDARGGRLNPPQISSLMTPKLNIPSAYDILSGLIKSEGEGRITLSQYHPVHKEYALLKKKLKTLIDSDNNQEKTIAYGSILKTGMKDNRVPLLRERLKISLPEGDEDPTLYSKALSDAVILYQKRNRLKRNGLLNKETIASLNTPSSKKQRDNIISNMERWRWLPDNLGERHIIVNIPEYKLRFYQNSQLVKETRVIVGKTANATPVLSSQLDNIVVNPFWTIPPSIMKKVILPGMDRDPSYAAKRGYIVRGKGKNISVRQPPGPRNALGFIKFLFPNNHAVYLHDTPNRSLFSSSSRALSFGCIRVQEPFNLAGMILEKDAPWTEKKLRSLIGSGERYIKVTQPTYIHLTYFTLIPDGQGEFVNYPDIYGFNSRVIKALGL